MKKFKLSKEQMKPLIPPMGGCIATDRITVDGQPVRFMFRDEPSDPSDSGWQFTAGDEDQAYMDDLSHHGIYAVNTLANYDPAIIPYVNAPVGSRFERVDGTDRFRPMTVKD